MKLFLKLLFKNSYLFLSNKYYREFLRLSLFHGDSTRQKKKNIIFLSYKFLVADPLSFIWQFREIFVDRYYNFKTENKQPVIYDCGANIGTSCLFFKSIYSQAKIKAFEADPEIATILETNLTENKINDIEIIAKAVWIHSDGIDIAPDGSDAASIFTAGKKIHVNSVRLKDFIEKETHINMLKMDIEGAETEVIKDCADVLGKADHIFIEYHSFSQHPQNLDEILQILTKNNFRYSIISALNKPQPFINKTYQNDHQMDLQLNIFAYKQT